MGKTLADFPTGSFTAQMVIFLRDSTVTNFTQKKTERKGLEKNETLLTGKKNEK